MSDTRRARVLAPAKVNLVLAVGEQSDDGYHQLVSVVQRVDLCDELEIEVRLPDAQCPDGGDASNAQQDRLTVHAPGLDGADTLVTSALREVREASGIDFSAHVVLHKHIPVAAGLGGGSADAAAALLVTNNLLGRPLSHGQLNDIAARIGSDVPALLCQSGRALMQGRGERVRELAPAAPSQFLLAWPGDSCSTAQVYAHHVSQRAALPDHEEVTRAADAGDWFNDLEPAGTSVCPSAAAILEAVRSEGATALLAGSGATVVARVSGSQGARLERAAQRAGATRTWLTRARQGTRLPT